MIEATEQTAETSQWVCLVCNWIYDPVVGAPEHGIAAGTAFADIPDDWYCPECGVTKADFEPMQR